MLSRDCKVELTAKYQPPQLHSQSRKELCSLAYITALAATAQCEIASVHFDIDSLDALVVPRGGKRLAFGVQMKATSKDCLTVDNLTFDLPIKNYNDLRLGESAAPCLLVVVHLPQSEPDWISHGQDSLILRNNAYYKNLLGHPDTANTSSVRIEIPTTQKLTTQSLQEILHHLASKKVLPT
jgi:hypothetical protein